MHTQPILTAYEAHADGEPGRVITAGMPDLIGATVFEKMQYMQSHHDDIRTLMLREPRGYPALCCNAIVPPCDPRADAGFIIMEQSEYPPMSGSNIICVTTVLLETGILPMREPLTTLTLEAPAGLIDVQASCHAGKVTQVKFRNVPAFAVHIDAPLEVPGLGHIKVDIAWGGMFFVLADAAQFRLELIPKNGRDIVRISEAILYAAQNTLPVTHPENPAITGPTITNLWQTATSPDTDGKGAITLNTGPFDPQSPQNASGILDRSPCGTGTCAKMAVLHAKGLLAKNRPYRNAGPLGTVFTGEIVETTKIGTYDAIIPTLSGQGFIYGKTDYMLDPTDPFQTGLTIGDIW
ncbi:MAG: proline racemase family protein [Aliishimia sp.]